MNSNLDSTVNFYNRMLDEGYEKEVALSETCAIMHESKCVLIQELENRKKLENNGYIKRFERKKKVKPNDETNLF